ncbi:DUF1361 domain-containing protein [Candidatus Peregrinibacteria bacterium]|nr:DUF1361 domain-containing protein [Candidatus Peregrinibacteria bacterium]
MTLLIEHKFYSKKWSSLLFHEKCQFLMLSGIFFFFFPNIPYVFTEIRHVLELCGNQDLYNRCFEAPWLIPILFLYSVIPIPLFVFTLKKFSTTLGKVFSSHLLAKIFPMFMLLMSALGVCFGLFERLNSWYIVTSPLLVANVGFSYLIVPEKLFLWGIFTMCFLAIYYFFEYFLYTKKGRYM